MLGGADLLSMGGLLDALMSVDYAKMVIDREIALMLKRMAGGYEEGSEADLGLDVIAEVGTAGMFIATSHSGKPGRNSKPRPSALANGTEGEGVSVWG